MSEPHLEQVGVQHEPRDSHFGSFVHLGSDDFADDPLRMDRYVLDRHP